MLTTPTCHRQPELKDKNWMQGFSCTLIDYYQHVVKQPKRTGKLAHLLVKRLIKNANNIVSHKILSSSRGFKKSQKLVKFVIAYVMQIHLNLLHAFSEINNTIVKTKFPLAIYCALCAVLPVCLKSY